MLKDALKADANDLQALSRLGILKSRMGRPNEALEPLEKVSTQNPLLYDARAEYAFLLFRGDPANAGRCVDTMTDILTSEPRHVLSLHYLGMCLYAKGDKAGRRGELQGGDQRRPDLRGRALLAGRAVRERRARRKRRRRPTRRRPRWITWRRRARSSGSRQRNNPPWEDSLGERGEGWISSMLDTHRPLASGEVAHFAK